MVNAIDVSRYAGVSSKTVYRVINNEPSISQETREKVLKVIENLGYVPNEAARRLRAKVVSGRTYNIGCVLFLESYNKFSDPYHSRILEGVDHEALERKYHILFTYTASQLNSNLTLLGRMVDPMNTDGIVTIGDPSTSSDRNLLKMIKSRVKTIVSIGAVSVTDTDNIDTDRVECGYKAVNYLVGLGHKRIGYIGCNTALLNKRFKGYTTALDEFGLKYDKKIVEGESAENTVEKGYEHMIKILERADPLPTAVFAYCDSNAIGAMRAISEKGLRIPDDISIMGVADIDEAKNTIPPLTTIRIGKKELGILGVRRLLERIQNPNISLIKTTLAVELVVRKSCRRVEGFIFPGRGK